MRAAIIGSGVAGLAAAQRLNEVGIQNVVFEAETTWGGHTRSDSVEGHWFDEGPHLSFSTDGRVRQLFAQGAKHEVEHSSPHIGSYFRGQWMRHPAQMYLHGLDPAFVERCLADLAIARKGHLNVVNYEDWLISAYGRTIAENFSFPYTRKYWTVNPSEMTIDWIGQRMYRPTVDEVVAGASSHIVDERFHYLQHFRYPLNGGFKSYLASLAQGSEIRLAKEVVGINVRDKMLRFSDNTRTSYDTLISTMPLDRMVACLENISVPAEVTEAAHMLLCTSMVLIDIGVMRSDLSDFDWLYVLDDDISLSRVTFPHKLSPTMAPVGRGSVQAEVYFSRSRPLNMSPREVGSRAVKELIDIGILHNEREVAFIRERVVKYSNVVYNRDRQACLDVLLPFVEKLEIELAGRYARWEYLWTDAAICSGWNASERIARLNSAADQQSISPGEAENQRAADSRSSA